MFSLSESFVTDAISRPLALVLPGEVESSFCEFVGFEVNSSLTGSVVEAFLSPDEAVDDVALTLAGTCGAEVEGASPLAACAYENAGRAGLVVPDIM